MSNFKVSPTFMVNLIDDIEKAMWDNFETIEKIHAFLIRFQEGHGLNTNFHLRYYDDDDSNYTRLNTSLTLQCIDDDDVLLKMAIDLGVKTPDVIYAVPEIKGILCQGYDNAAQIFESAYKNVHDEPDASIVSANSALESIIKHIAEEISFPEYDRKDTLSKLMKKILKEFNFTPKDASNTNIRNIASGLITVSQAIEQLRSENTSAHGKEKDDHIIDHELYAKLVINAVSSIGLFLIDYYENVHSPEKSIPSWDDEIPF